MMIIENNQLKKVEKADVTKDGWVIVKKNIKKIGERAFEAVKKDVKVVVFEPAHKDGEGCESIAHHAFEGCENLKLVLLPNSLKEIGPSAFCNTGLVRIEIPESVKKIDNMAFMKCSNLKKVIFNGNADDWKAHLSDANFDGTLLFDGVFDYCKNVEKFVYRKNPVDMGLDLHKFANAQVVILDDKQAEEFWLKKLQQNPMEYRFLDDVRATDVKYDSFRKNCKNVIEKRYKTQTGLEDVSFYVNSAMKTKQKVNEKTKL